MDHYILWLDFLYVFNSPLGMENADGCFHGGRIRSSARAIWRFIHRFISSMANDSAYVTLEKRRLGTLLVGASFMM
jgi:hypothetical protein